jgi:hypothetical protein
VALSLIVLSLFAHIVVILGKMLDLQLQNIREDVRLIIAMQNLTNKR